MHRVNKTEEVMPAFKPVDQDAPLSEVAKQRGITRKQAYHELLDEAE